MIDSKGIKKNISITLLVQMVSFAVSLVMNLFLPKYISEIDYSYWQTFLLYVGYVPLLHLGFPGGLLLKYSQYDYDELDKPLVRSQFSLFFIIEVSFALLIILSAISFTGGIPRIILLFIGLAVVLNNMSIYTSYTFQLTNRISKYAFLILSERLFLGLGVVLLIVCGKAQLLYVLLVYVGASVVANLWGYFKNRELYFGTFFPLKKTLIEFKSTLLSGGMLLLAALSSNFIVGGAKMVIQWRYDALLFGQMAFAFSVSNLFLTFVSAASIALFPSIKRIEQDLLPVFYEKIRGNLSVMLFFVLLLYFPGCKILQLWLPNYANGLIYLGILMPIIVFASKVTLLTDNYLKAYRKEKLMLCINATSVLIAFSSYLVCAYIFDNLTALLFCLIAVVMIRSVVSEIFVMKLIDRNFSKDFVVEFLMVLAFVFCTMKMNLVYGACLYGVFLLLYFVWKLKSIGVKNFLKNFLRK